MGEPAFLRRRTLLLLGGLAAVGAGTGVYAATATRGPVPDRERVRTDTAPLRSRFGALGQLTDPHWLGYNPHDSGREILPDQDPQIRVVGIARLPAGTAASLTAAPGYGFAPAEPRAVPEGLAEFLPADARWVTSVRYDEHLTKSRYTGRFHLDPVTDSVWFDTVNPGVPQG